MVNHEMNFSELKRRIKNYKEMSTEELIISLLKSKQSIAELFINNLDDEKISESLID